MKHLTTVKKKLETIQEKRTEYNNLSIKARKLKQEFEKIQSKADKISFEIALPDLKKKYEGKMFKYRNSSYAHGSWFIYYLVLKVIGFNKVLVKRFEYDKVHESWIFCNKSKEYIHSLGNECSKAEFDRQHKKMLAYAKLLKKF